MKLVWFQVLPLEDDKAEMWALDSEGQMWTRIRSASRFWGEWAKCEMPYDLGRVPGAGDSKT